jgi:protein tyrosine phosphatase
MIWQEKSNIIITLANLVEKGRKKMSQFWPSNSMQEKIEISNTFCIKIIEEFFPNEQICIRKLKLRNHACNSEREIFQIHFLGWPDHGVPNDLSSLNEIYKYQKLFEEEGRKSELNGSPVVHCSAGIGRTATYISFVHGVQKIESLRGDGQGDLSLEKIDLASIVKKIRKQRNGSVQTEDQYLFIYRELNFYLNQFKN